MTKKSVICTSYTLKYFLVICAVQKFLSWTLKVHF